VRTRESPSLETGGMEGCIETEEGGERVTIPRSFVSNSARSAALWASWWTSARSVWPKGATESAISIRRPVPAGYPRPP
jgi:hypothetical protein